MKAHFQDIQIDDELKKANIIHLVEISLTPNDEKDVFNLEGYQTSLIESGNGKGMATFYEEDKFKPATKVNMDMFQIIKFKHEKLDIINLYRSQLGNSQEILDHLKNLTDDGKTTMITGDFNSCFIENFNSRLIQGLLILGFDQLVHEPTHIKGRHIDHVYFQDPTERLRPRVARYSPYYSDHDEIVAEVK